MINILNDNIGFVELVDSMGSDLSIVNSARISYNRDSKELDYKDERLIKYLLKNKHTSPFEHVLFTFNIKTPLFIARQWMRHRTWSFNEISRRYTDENIEFYIPKEFRLQKDDNKQMSSEEVLSETESFLYHSEIRNQCLISLQIYSEMVSKGVAREIARGILPQFMYTNFFGTVDLHNLLHFLELRTHIHSQHEMRLYAIAIENIVKEVVPITYKYWKELKEE